MNGLSIGVWSVLAHVDDSKSAEIKIEKKIKTEQILASLQSQCVCAWECTAYQLCSA